MKDYESSINECRQEIEQNVEEYNRLTMEVKRIEERKKNILNNVQRLKGKIEAYNELKGEKSKGDKG